MCISLTFCFFPSPPSPLEYCNSSLVFVLLLLLLSLKYPVIESISQGAHVLTNLIGDKHISKIIILSIYNLILNSYEEHSLLYPYLYNIKFYSEDRLVTMIESSCGNILKLDAQVTNEVFKSIC